MVRATTEPNQSQLDMMALSFRPSRSLCCLATHSFGGMFSPLLVDGEKVLYQWMVIVFVLV